MMTESMKQVVKFYCHRANLGDESDYFRFIGALSMVIACGVEIEYLKIGRKILFVTGRSEGHEEVLFRA